jgi:hypothetical protein
MPAREPILLPDGWQIVRRADGWYLQRRLPGTDFWLDVHGPVRQRYQAVRAYQRTARTTREEPTDHDA